MFRVMDVIRHRRVETLNRLDRLRHAGGSTPIVGATPQRPVHAISGSAPRGHWPTPNTHGSDGSGPAVAGGERLKIDVFTVNAALPQQEQRPLAGRQ
jgi:hypothetical protein